MAIRPATWAGCEPGSTPSTHCPGSVIARSAVHQNVDPFRDLAFNANLSIHHSGKLFTDRQSQPGAAVLARRGAVNLRKTLKQSAQPIGRNPNARIAYSESQFDPLGVPAFDPHAQFNRTPLREFHRVIHQIDQNLPQPVRIAA